MIVVLLMSRPQCLNPLVSFSLALLLPSQSPDDLGASLPSPHVPHLQVSFPFDELFPTISDELSQALSFPFFCFPKPCPSRSSFLSGGSLSMERPDSGTATAIFPFLGPFSFSPFIRSGAQFLIRANVLVLVSPPRQPSGLCFLFQVSTFSFVYRFSPKRTSSIGLKRQLSDPCCVTSDSLLPAKVSRHNLHLGGTEGCFPSPPVISVIALAFSPCNKATRPHSLFYPGTMLENEEADSASYLLLHLHQTTAPPPTLSSCTSRPVCVIFLSPGRLSPGNRVFILP